MKEYIPYPVFVAFAPANVVLAKEIGKTWNADEMRQFLLDILKDPANESAYTMINGKPSQTL